MKPESLFLETALWGGLSGIIFGATRTFPVKALRDLLVIPALLWGWLEVAFAVWQGDVRMVSTLCYLGSFGISGWFSSRYLSWLFFRFWGIIWKILGLPLVPLKIFFQFAKILVASGQKTVTILWSHHVEKRAARKKRRAARKGQEERNRGRQRKNHHRLESQ